MKHCAIGLVLFLLTQGCTQNNTKHITEFSQNDIKNGILIDVRTSEEYKVGHIKNALNIDWYADDFITHFKDIEKKRAIYLYCKKGGRSLKAQEKLTALGYTNVINLEGGYDALSK